MFYVDRNAALIQYFYFIAKFVIKIAMNNQLSVLPSLQIKLCIQTFFNF